MFATLPLSLATSIRLEHICSKNEFSSLMRITLNKSRARTGALIMSQLWWRKGYIILRLPTRIFKGRVK